MLRTLGLTPVLLGLAVSVGAINGCGGDGAYNPFIDPADFTPVVDNPFFPLTPGATLTYRGQDGSGEVETITVIVTPQTKVIMGVTCAQVRDTVEVDGEVVEDTLDWFAQHDSGTVWYCGEDSKEYQNGVVVSTAGSWQAGVDGAKPGIIMPANPRPGQKYRQEFYSGEAEDMAKVLRLNASVTVPFGSFDNCPMTREWSPLEPGVAENKYYAPGIGLVFAKMVEGGTGFVKLVDVK